MSTSAHIRPMEITDLPAVYAIEQAAYSYPWTKSILQDCLKVGYQCWVSESNSEVIGYAIAMMVLNECHLLNICIDPKKQRLGHGRQLLEYVIAQVKARNVQIIFLEVRYSNAAAINLYNRLGFNEIGTRKDYYPNDKGREDAILFALEITNNGSS